MRVIGGKFRSRRLKRPSAGKVRPTKDRVRESIFNVLGPYVHGRSVLDLFAGSGAFAFEAISRGAKEAYIVDREPSSTRAISENSKSLSVEGIVTIKRKDVFQALRDIREENLRFDLVFADPPYSLRLGRKTLNMACQYDILFPSGVMVLEHSSEECLPEHLEGINLFKQKTYKDIVVSFYKRDEQNSDISRYF